MYKTFWLHNWSHIHEYNHTERDHSHQIQCRNNITHTHTHTHTPHIIIITLCDSFMSSLSGFHLQNLTCIIHYTQAQGHLQQRYYCLQFTLPLIADLCCVLLLLAWTHFLLYQLLDYAAQHVHVGRYACMHIFTFCMWYLFYMIFQTGPKPPPTKPPLPTVHPTLDCRLVLCARPTCPNPLPPPPGQCCPICLGKQFICFSCCL